MTDHAQRLLEEALALPPDEREALIEALSASPRDEPATLRPRWKAAVRDRLGDLAEGRVEAVPGHEVEERLRRTLAPR